LNSGSSVFFLTVVLKRLFFNSFAEEGGKMQLFNKKKRCFVIMIGIIRKFFVNKAGKLAEK